MASVISAIRSNSVFPILFCVGCIAAIVATIYLVPEDGRTIAQSSTILATSGIAFVTSILFVRSLRQRRGHMSDAMMFLSLGLFLWFFAEGIWSYYVNFLGVQVPYPSIADVFYLSAYLPIGYSLHKLSRKAPGLHQEDKLVITTIAITLTAFITNVFILEIVDSAIGFTELSTDESILLAVSIAYPLLDGYLFVPSIIILYTLRKSRAHLTWLLLAASTLVMAAADTGFGYTALVEIEALASETVWDILYNVSYTLLATAMICGIQSLKTETLMTEVQGVGIRGSKDAAMT